MRVCSTDFSLRFSIFGLKPIVSPGIHPNRFCQATTWSEFEERLGVPNNGATYYWRVWRVIQKESVASQIRVVPLPFQ